MDDRLSGSIPPKKGPDPPKARRSEHSQDEPATGAYQSQDRYRRHKTPKTPKTPQTPQTWASEDERSLWRLGQAMAREEELSPTTRGLTNSMEHLQLHARGEGFSTSRAGAMHNLRHQRSNVTLSERAVSPVSHRRVSDGTAGQGEMGVGHRARSSKPYEQSSSGDRQPQLDGFSISPSHSIVDEKQPEIHKKTKANSYNHPPSILKGFQSGKLSHHSRNRQNALYSTQAASPFIVGQQASSLPRSRTNFGSPSPFIREQQPSGFTPSYNGIENRRPFAQRRPLSPELFTAPANATGDQRGDSPDFHGYHGGMDQHGRQNAGYSPAMGPSSSRSRLSERGSSSGYNSQHADSGDQLGNPHMRGISQAREYPRFGANKFANLQDVVKNDGRDSPTSSHHSTISGYKPAHMRYGHGLRSGQLAAESSDIPAPLTPRYPMEHGQRIKGMQPRGYSGQTTSRQNISEHGHGGEAFAMRSQELENRREQHRSKSARGFYSPNPYGDRPLPPLPQKMRWRQENAGLGLAVREAQEELELEDEMRNRNFDEREEYVKGIRRLDLRKSKSTNFANRSGSPTNYQPRAFTPDAKTPKMASTPRMPPQVPRPQPPRPATALNNLINSASVGSGSDCLARISEVAMSTEKIMQEFMAQSMVERFVKSLSKSNERMILACLKELDSKIDWLGDSLWKGSEDARRLFANQHNETIVVIHTRMIRNLTNLTWDLQRIATEKSTHRCVKNMKPDVVAVLESIVPHLMKLVRSMETYVGTSMIGNQRAGKGDILVTRFRRCLEAWENLGKNDAKDSTPTHARRSDFS